MFRKFPHSPTLEGVAEATGVFDPFVQRQPLIPPAPADGCVKVPSSRATCKTVLPTQLSHHYVLQARVAEEAFGFSVS